MYCGKNGKAKSIRYANPNGSREVKRSLHVQRIASEAAKAEYNLATSPQHLEQVKRYAELARNCKK